MHLSKLCANAIFAFLICASVQYFALTDIPFAQIIHGTLYLVFENHPNSLDMTYGEHMRVSLYFAFNSLMAFFIFLVHAFIPILFNHKGIELLEYTIELSKTANLNKKK